MRDEEKMKEKLAEMRISQLISEFPASKAVLFNHFGASCFDCPASKEETVALGVRVHSADSECFFNELIRVTHASRSQNKDSGIVTDEGVDKVAQNG